MKHLMMNVKR